MSLSISVPIRLVSEANAHEHWRKRCARANGQRNAVRSVLWATLGSLAGRRRLDEWGSARVLITRVAPRSLDSDNAVGSCKHVRDEIAAWLGVDDRNPRVTWDVEQRKGEPKQYAVDILIDARPV